MTRVADRRAARREARKRRAELRLFGAAWKYGAAFDARACAPILAPPGVAEISDVPEADTDELLADLVAAALHFAWAVPPPSQRRRRRRSMRSAARHT
jgi:hypothetical protein